MKIYRIRCMFYVRPLNFKNIMLKPIQIYSSYIIVVIVGIHNFILFCVYSEPKFMTSAFWPLKTKILVPSHKIGWLKLVVQD